MANAKKQKRREKRTVDTGNVYIQATFNNTIVTITDLNGNAIAWASSGGLGFVDTVCSSIGCGCCRTKSSTLWFT